MKFGLTSFQATKLFNQGFGIYILILHLSVDLCHNEKHFKIYIILYLNKNAKQYIPTLCVVNK